MMANATVEKEVLEKLLEGESVEVQWPFQNAIPLDVGSTIAIYPPREVEDDLPKMAVVDEVVGAKTLLVSLR